MLRATVLVLLLAAVSACITPRPSGGPAADAVTAGGLSLTVSGHQFTRGEAVPLTLTNEGPTTYEGGVLGCATTERWAAGAWTPAEDDARACILMLATVAPGETMEGEIALDLPPGTYRFVHALTPVGGSEAVTVATRAFQIGR